MKLLFVISASETANLADATSPSILADTNTTTSPSILADTDIASIETPSPKKAKLNDSFHIETPIIRSKGEFLGPKFTSVFIGESSQIDNFMEQINNCSACIATPGCSGKYCMFYQSFN